MEDRYLHGTAPHEQARLTTLNEMLNRACLSQIGLRGGERIVDFGCGLAQLTRQMARASGGVRAVGIESSPAQIAEARRQAREAGEEDLVDLRAGDAAAAPLRDEEWGAFDLAHARFLLEHLEEPAAAVRAMVRSVRPGGRIVLADDDHDLLRLWPEPPGIRELWGAYLRAFERNGNDPAVGRKLVSLLHDAGAGPVRATWIFFGGCSGMPEHPMLVDNLIGLCLGMRDPILATGLITGPAMDAAIDALRAWARRPDAALWFAMAWAEGIRPDA